MLEKVEIKRFKSIKELSLDFGRVNIFVGGNGSGKSNILEAIGLASAAIYRGLGDSDLSRKGIRLTPAELMKTALKSDRVAESLQINCYFQKDIVYKCNLVSKEDDPLIRFKSESCDVGKGNRQFGRSGIGSTALRRPIQTILDKDRGMWDQIKTAYDFPDSLINQFYEFGRYAIFTPQTDVLRGSRTGSIDSSPFGLHGEGLPTAVRNVLHNRATKEVRSNKKIKSYIEDALDLAFLPGWTNGVRTGKIDTKLVSRGIQNQNSDMVYFIDKYMNIKRNTLSVYDSSEGTLFLLFVAMLLAHTDSPRYFSIDNIDNALNPLMTRRLLEKILSSVDAVHSLDLDFGPRQIFMTSHNPTSLDAFDIFNENQRIFVVKRSRDGATVVDRLTPSPGATREDWAIMANGRKLSQLWIDGEIEGINGSEEI